MDSLISRHDAIDAILADKIDAISLKVMTALGEGRLALTLNDACDRHIRDIEKLPSAEPEQRWIPCSERLPEKPNMYEVTDSRGDVVRFVFCDTESSREYWRRCAKAWMPLPEPYEEDDHVCINAGEIHGGVLKTIPIFGEEDHDE